MCAIAHLRHHIFKWIAFFLNELQASGKG